jgi:hypothetical protein
MAGKRGKTGDFCEQPVAKVCKQSWDKWEKQTGHATETSGNIKILSRGKAGNVWL